jgi:trimethyllysine dioxygenase
VSTIVSIQPSDVSLEVTWSDGMVTRYPWIWLRDHAHDEASLHPVTQQRMVFTARLPRTLRALDSTFDGDELVITWDVLEPESRLPVSFLEKYRHPRVARASLDIPVTLWSGAAVESPTVAYADVMRTDAAVAQWLGKTVQYGFCIVKDTPPTAGATEELLRRVAYVRHTIFGGFWEYSGDMAMADTGYSTTELRNHTDGTYSHDAPGFQMLHCLAGAVSGGESTLVDGFAIARRLESESPDAFEVLSSVAVPGQYIGDGSHLMAARPVFRHDHTGRLVQVSFNNYDRAPFLLDESDMVAFYDAIRLFDEIANEPSMQWRHTLQPGEALLFDNWRVLHGRAAYTGDRRICGGYLNREDVESRLRQMLAPAPRRS